MAVDDAAQIALDHIWQTYGDDAETMARKLAEYAWLQGWIASLNYLKSNTPLTGHAPENPYIRD